MVFGRWARRAAEDVDGHALFDAVKEQLPGADAATLKIVTSIAGLLGGVAYADRDYSPAEEAQIVRGLEQIQGLSQGGVQAIVQVLRDHLLDIATVQSTRYCRALREEADRDLRLNVLDMLVDIAAADGHISHDEVALLRTTAQALGLDQQDYNRAQSRHRDKLKLLD